MGFGGFKSWQISACGHLAEEPEDPRLVPRLLAGTGESEGILGQPPFRAIGPQMALGDQGDPLGLHRVG